MWENRQALDYTFSPFFSFFLFFKTHLVEKYLDPPNVRAHLENRLPKNSCEVDAIVYSKY